MSTDDIKISITTINPWSAADTQEIHRLKKNKISYNVRLISFRSYSIFYQKKKQTNKERNKKHYTVQVQESKWVAEAASHFLVFQEDSKAFSSQQWDITWVCHGVFFGLDMPETPLLGGIQKTS